MSGEAETAEAAAEALRERISAALGESLDYCTRCKICDRQLDAIMAVLADGAADRLGEVFVSESRMRALEVRDGRVTLDAVAAREVIGMWAGAARALLKDAENYSETEMEFRVGGTGERYAFTVQKVGKQTPHQLRRAAEAEVARLRGLLADAGIESAP